MKRTRPTGNELAALVLQTQKENGGALPYINQSYACETCGNTAGLCHPGTGMCFVCGSDDFIPMHRWKGTTPELTEKIIILYQSKAYHSEEEAKIHLDAQKFANESDVAKELYEREDAGTTFDGIIAGYVAGFRAARGEK